ncbi:MAG: LamG domain-containing protein [Planctomycetes bacterium]|nr:LamG domain-containing protein [Planctomycetota bacterium]
MRILTTSFLAVGIAAGLSAQTSADYLVHHEFLPPASTVYVNSGSTGTVNDGTPSGSVTLAIGAIGVGVTLGGNPGDEINCGVTPLLGAQERTVSVWAKTSATAGIVTPLAFGTNPGNGTKWDMDIDCVNGGVFELGISGGRTTGQGPALNDGQWHMMTAVLPTGATNLNQVRLFVDGAFIYTGSGNQIVNTTTGNVIVGRSANPLTQIQFFPGDVDDPALWSVALGDAQVKGLYDVAVAPSLGYSPREFEMLLEVYRQNQTEVTISTLQWRRATGMTGPAGLTALANGGYELVFDTTTGDGVRVVRPATTATIGVGCPGTGNQTPAIGATGTPVTGTSFSIDLSNARANSFAGIIVAFSRNDMPLGNGCTSYPQLPGVSSLMGVSGAGTASVNVSIPAAPALIGFQLFAQWGVIDPAGAYGPGVAALSNGLQATIGDV